MICGKYPHPRVAHVGSDGVQQGSILTSRASQHQSPCDNGETDVAKPRRTFCSMQSSDHIRGFIWQLFAGHACNCCNRYINNINMTIPRITDYWDALTQKITDPFRTLLATTSVRSTMFVIWIVFHRHLLLSLNFVGFNLTEATIPGWIVGAAGSVSDKNSEHVVSAPDIWITVFLILSTNTLMTQVGGKHTRE